VNRRRWIVLAAASLPLAVRAHHGWSSFDLARPIYLEGRAVNVAWRNPHAETDLDVAADLKLPADLAQRALPAQTAQVDAPGLLKAARLPTRKDKRWHIELAPLSRMEAWKVPEIKNGDAVQMLGFTFAGERGEPILRVEYLWLGGKAYGLRSSPA
jgi:Family of unknown function (DUF6152)